jgi:hypothetical protein
MAMKFQVIKYFHPYFIQYILKGSRYSEFTHRLSFMVAELPWANEFKHLPESVSVTPVTVPSISFSLSA